MDEETRQELDRLWKKVGEIEKRSKITKEDISQPVAHQESFFDVEEESLTVLKTVGEKTEEKTKNTALLTLLGYKEILKKEKVLASEIKRNVALNKIPVENFGTYINELIPQSILRIGKPRSRTVAYKLTVFGHAKAKALQKEILENEQSK